MTDILSYRNNYVWRTVEVGGREDKETILKTIYNVSIINKAGSDKYGMTLKYVTFLIMVVRFHRSENYILG